MLPAAGFFSYLRDSAYAYPILLSLHIVALVLLGGMILVQNLRVLGLGMRSYSVPDVATAFRAPKRFAFLFAAVCGVLMFGAKARMYSHYPWFWVKLGLILLIGVNYLVFGRGIGQVSGKAKVGAGLSLLLWTGVIFAARGRSTIKDIMHSMVDPSADFLFQSVETIADEHGIREKAPQTDAEWEEVRQRVLVLLDAPKILAAPGLRAARPRDRSKNPVVESEPEEIQRLLDAQHPDFVQRTQRLHDAASAAMAAVEMKNKDTLLQALDGIDKACESCHLHYWYPNDKRAREAAKADGVNE